MDNSSSCFQKQGKIQVVTFIVLLSCILFISFHFRINLPTLFSRKTIDFPSQVNRKFNFTSCKMKEIKRAGPKNCRLNVTLPVFDHSHSEEFQVFFLETSGRPYLKGKQACTVESAALRSCLTSKVILRSSYLDLSVSQSLCDLYYEYANVEFYSANYVELFRSTPAEGFTNLLEKVVSHNITHLSDIGRMAFLYKYGGLYLDLDIIVLKILRDLSNFIVIENGRAKPDKECRIRDGAQNGHYINNGHLHFEAGHDFPWYFMRYGGVRYDTKKNDRHQLGPPVVWQAARKMYGIKSPTPTNQIVGQGEANRQLSILPDFTFLPADFNEIGEKLYPRKPKTPKQWDDLFKCSYAVHFFSNKWSHKKVSGDPGRDAYSYLGPTHCPQVFKHYRDEF